MLYLPASNARAIEKARSLPADVIVLDLEDAVAPDAKEEARAAAVAAVQAGGFGSREVAIRANGLDTPWGAADLAAIAGSGVDAVVVPKVSSPADIAACEAALATAPA
jgi:citrate lyase subunit beta/citryl-CoA lyase